MHTPDIDAILFRFKRLKPIIIVRMWLKASLNITISKAILGIVLPVRFRRQRPVWAIRGYYFGPDPEI